MSYQDKVTNTLGKVTGSLAGLATAVESYVPLHEGGHAVTMEAFDTADDMGLYENNSELFHGSSNYGDTAVVEKLEDFGILPDNDTISDLSYTEYIKDVISAPESIQNGVGYVTGSVVSNPIVKGSIAGSGNLGVLGFAGATGYLGNKFDSFTTKVYSTAMATAPTLNIAKDYMSGTPGDMATVASLTGLDSGTILAGSALTSAGIAAYNWSDEIGDVGHKVIEGAKEGIDSIIPGSGGTIQKEFGIGDEVYRDINSYVEDFESSLEPNPVPA